MLSDTSKFLLMLGGVEVRASGDRPSTKIKVRTCSY